MKELSRTASAVQISSTMAIDALAKQMKAEGVDVIGFGAGEPDFNTPAHIKAAADRAIAANLTRYTPASGTPELKEAVCQRMREDCGLDYKPSQVVVSTGAKHCVYLALRAVVNPGDEIILPAPYWVSYLEMIKMVGGQPVVVTAGEGARFKMTAEQLAAAITPKTKALILNNPGNPTGMVYGREELEAIARVCVEHDIYVISDEIYCGLLYDGARFVSAAALGEDMKERVILINGVSKSYAMTGWRIGWLPQDCVEEMRRAFEERRNYIVERMNEIGGVSCLKPEGAFYVMMNVEKLIGKTIHGSQIQTSKDFCTAFLKHGLVAAVPGEGFGAPGFVRWSYSTSMENIEKGMDRLAAFLKG